jgi:hypothetical protein
VQADLLREKIDAQANANDSDATLVSLDQNHELTQRLHLLLSHRRSILSKRRPRMRPAMLRELYRRLQLLHREPQLRSVLKKLSLQNIGSQQQMVAAIDGSLCRRVR